MSCFVCLKDDEATVTHSLPSDTEQTTATNNFQDATTGEFRSTSLFANSTHNSTIS